MAGKLKAVISDVHGNLEALEAVVDDMHALKAEEIYCLGDVVGYGPDPGECLDILMHSAVFLLGNHEEAMLADPTDFTPEAATAARWTKQELRRVYEGSNDPKARFAFLADLPPTREEGDCLYVHGSPRDPTKEYIYPNEVKDGGKMWDVFRRIERCCFVGHTHFPGIFTETYQFYPPAALPAGYRLPKGKTLCNVGSVGQPRDNDWRACYVLFDGKSIRFRRVEYDIKKTVSKMKQFPELHPFLKLYPIE